MGNVRSIVDGIFWFWGKMGEGWAFGIWRVGRWEEEDVRRRVNNNKGVNNTKFEWKVLKVLLFNVSERLEFYVEMFVGLEDKWWMIVGLFRIGMDYGEFLEDFYVKKREIELWNFNLRLMQAEFEILRKIFFFLFNLSLRIHTTYIYFTCTF